MRDNQNHDQNTIRANFQLSRLDGVSDPFHLTTDLTLPGSGITAIFGHSGCGKTTLLRCMAGLEHAGNGALSVNGEIWQGPSVFVPTHKRPLGYVFQESSLFPHLTAAKNLEYAIKRSGHPRDAALYDKVLEVMGIADVLPRLPRQLSGGERQRVAIARALLIKPKLMLMDEPLAALDHQRKQEILPYLENLHQHFQTPVVYVTHSIDEVARLADHVVIMENGEVVSQGALTEVFSRTDLPVVFQEDTGVILQGTVEEVDHEWHLAKVAFNGGAIWVKHSGDRVGQSVRLRVLAKDVSITLAPHQDSSILNRMPATITEITCQPDDATALISLSTGDLAGDNGENTAEKSLGNATLLARLTSKSVHHLGLAAGMSVWAQIKSAALVR